MGTVEESFEEIGMVKVRGEIWQAESTVGSIVQGQIIRVTGRRKFTLLIEGV